MRINFDMDGTIADLYAVEGWLDYLEAGDAFPYENAKPMMRFSALARILNRLQKEGYEIAIISWLSKAGSEAYNAEVIKAKQEWLRKHLPSVHWDSITIVEYGTPKQMFCECAEDILFDDEARNRNNWTGVAYDVTDIMGILKNL